MFCLTSSQVVSPELLFGVPLITHTGPVQLQYAPLMATVWTSWSLTVPVCGHCG